MTVVPFRARCPQCHADALWTETEKRTGDPDIDIDCRCGERVVPARP